MQIEFKITLDSGASVELTKEQAHTVSRWIESLVLSTDKTKTEVQKKPKITYGLYTKEEDEKIRSFMREYPIHTRGRSGALKKLARDLNRTYGGVEMRAYLLRKSDEKTTGLLG